MNKSHNVWELLTEEEYKQFKPFSKTMFAANKLILTNFEQNQSKRF